MRSFKLVYCLILSLLLLLSLALSLAALSRPTDTPEAVPSAEKTSGTPQTKTFLLLGIDQVSYSADVILTVHLAADGSIRLLQLPRDSYTAKGDKLNAFFASACTASLEASHTRSEAYHDGALAMERFLLSAMGLTFDGYAVLTLDNLARLVDAVDGVEVTLPKALSYEDPAQNLQIHLEEGTHRLSGEEACAFVRCRNAYLSADYGRLDAQKLFMTAFLKKLKGDALSSSARLTFLLDACRYVKTDLAVSEILTLGKELLGQPLSAFSFATVKGNSLKKGSQLYEVLPQATLSEAITWLGGNPDALQSHAFSSSDPDVLALYRATPLYPLDPVSADTLDDEGLAIP